MNYQVLDVKVKDTEEIGKLYTYFLDNSQEIDPNRVRPVIVICPGGGYGMVSDREAEPIAMRFLGAGYHAVILRYSVAPAAHYPTALRQLAWTVAYLREHAAEYHIDPNKVVVAGFSAGGHLAASYGVFWKKKTFLAEELGVDAEQLRPNGLLLSYPVITSGPKAHRGSFTKLLGDRYDELVDEMSLENQSASIRRRPSCGIPRGRLRAGRKLHSVLYSTACTGDSGRNAYLSGRRPWPWACKRRDTEL